MMLRALLVGVAALACLALGRGVAAAEVERYAILIGNNQGFADEAELRYAERDVDKLDSVLRDLGGFAAENVTVLRGAAPAAVRRALIAVNDRIRSGDGEALLFVYYSGHADAAGLHLGRASLRNDELTKLVRGSPATIRLLVLDSCRSGAVTRGKGGRAVPAFDVTVEESLAGEGAIFFSSSASNEDSQESDELQGSFFTHFLVSGLLGAADTDGDGQVVVDEAYRYTYENTLRASSRTQAGTQHPTFRYDVRGQGKITLSWPTATARDRGQLTVPNGRSYLIFERDLHGPVAAEVGASDARRTLTLRAGRYAVRGRGPDDLLEGTITISAGRPTSIDEAALDRVGYARLVRKGGARQVAHAITVEAAARSGLYGDVSPCFGGALGYRVELPLLTLHGRVAGCRATFANDTLSATATELGGQLAALHVWDLRRVSLEAGVSLGLGWLHQRYSTRGLAPDRDALAPHLGVELGAAVDLDTQRFATAGLRAQTYFFNRLAGGDTDAELTAVFAVSASVGIGWRY